MARRLHIVVTPFPRGGGCLGGHAIQTQPGARPRISSSAQEPGGRCALPRPARRRRGGVHRGTASPSPPAWGKLRVFFCEWSAWCARRLDLPSCRRCSPRTRRPGCRISEFRARAVFGPRPPGECRPRCRPLAFHFDELLRAHAGFFLHGGLVITTPRAAHPGGRAAARGHVVVYQLQQVFPVTVAR